MYQPIYKHNGLIKIISGIRRCGIDKNIAEQTIKTRLLVSELINNRNTQNKFIHDIYQWFSNDIHIYVNEQFELTTNIYSTESDDLGEKTKFLNKAGINISKLLYVGQSLKSIHTNEVGKDIIFDFEAEESAGTKTLLDLSKDLIEVLKGGRITQFQNPNLRIFCRIHFTMG